MMRKLWIGLFACVIGYLPLTVDAVSQTELQNSYRFERVISRADTGGGDGKYIDLQSVSTMPASEGQQKVRGDVYILMPASNMILRLQLVYNYDSSRSMAHMVETRASAGRSYIDIWRAKQENPGITGQLVGANAYTNAGESRTAPLYKQNLEAMILPPHFDGERYAIANRLYKQAYGYDYDDER